MFRFALIFIIVVHGLIHLLGFVKAFELASVEQLTQPISKGGGTLWLLAAILFLATGVAFMLHSNYWVIGALTAVILSQILIFGAWSDAKFGTIANIIIVLAALLGYAAWSFENGFHQDVKAALERTQGMEMEVLTDPDLQHLPQPVQRYLRYAGVVGQPKVKNFRVTFSGQMREKGGEWFDFTSEQYNFFDEPERLFFMKARVKGIPTVGYHAFKDGEASMTVKVLSAFPVVQLEGEVMQKAETVTLFNDICLMAPAVLIDDRIEWTEVDENTAKAKFTHRDITISATLYFDEMGRLIDFESNDRTEITSMQQMPFSTPVHDYQMINGHQLLRSGDAVWHFPEGEFVYGKFYLKELDYNIP